MSGAEADMVTGVALPPLQLPAAQAIAAAIMMSAAAGQADGTADTCELSG